MALWVPPKVTAGLAEESRRREAETAKALWADERWDWLKRFNAQLDRMVHGMKLVQCPDPAPVDAVAQGAFPGYWHIAWPGYNGGPLNVQPLVIDPDTGRPRVGGVGFRAEPGAWVFDFLAEADLWNERANRERARIKREAERERERRKEIEREEMTRDILERYKAVNGTSVSMSRDTPWSQNVAGRRGSK